MITNDVLKHIRLIALNNAHDLTVEGYIERAYRHYSKTYHTPLHTAKEIVNAAEVVLIYMEDEIADMNAEEIATFKEKVSPSIKPLFAMPDQEDNIVEELDDDAWVAQQMMELEKKDKIEKKEPIVPSSLTDAANEAQKALHGLYKQLNQPVPANLEGSMSFGKDK
jgi:hypothetical protein